MEQQQWGKFDRIHILNCLLVRELILTEEFIQCSVVEKDPNLC